MNFYRAGGLILNMDHVLVIAKEQQWDTGQHNFVYKVIMKNGAVPTTVMLTQRDYASLMEAVDQNKNPWRLTD
jgi:hypothetical protein